MRVVLKFHNIKWHMILNSMISRVTKCNVNTISVKIVMGGAASRRIAEVLVAETAAVLKR